MFTLPICPGFQTSCLLFGNADLKALREADFVSALGDINFSNYREFNPIIITFVLKIVCKGKIFRPVRP